MNAPKLTAATLLRLEERLRQERETFDQRKEQEARWFSLRLRMGYTAALMLPTVAIACGYILFNQHEFDGTVVASAGAALFVDVLGLLGAVWKVVLNTGSITQLEPLVAQSSLSTEAPMAVDDEQSET